MLQTGLPTGFFSGVLRYGLFRVAIKPVSWCDMACFSTRYGPFQGPKWCFLQCEEIALKYKLLIFNIL